MESNKKRKRAEKEPNEERDRYYKKLRREQEKRRKKKKALATKEKCDARAPRGDSVKKGYGRQNKKPRIDIGTKLLTRGRVLLSAALEKGTKGTNLEMAKEKKSCPRCPRKIEQRSERFERD